MQLNLVNKIYKPTLDPLLTRLKNVNRVFQNEIGMDSASQHVNEFFCRPLEIIKSDYLQQLLREKKKETEQR